MRFATWNHSILPFRITEENNSWAVSLLLWIRHLTTSPSPSTGNCSSLTLSNVTPRTGDLDAPLNWPKLQQVAGGTIELGHILASTLGGLNDDNWQNFTPLYKNANAPAMLACERFLNKLVTECKHCVHLTITVQGYGRNRHAPDKAKRVMPSRIVMKWSTDDGKHRGRFVINNLPDETTSTKCLVRNLPCRQ